MMSNPFHIIIVDDDAATLAVIREIMAKEGYLVRTATDAQSALECIAKEPPALVISDIQMPGMDGLELLTKIQQHAPETGVILLTAYGSLKTAVEGIKAGAFDYLSKPFLVDELRLVAKRFLEHRRVLHENQPLGDRLSDPYRLDLFVGKSPSMVSVYKVIARVAQTNATVLIQGESGTGKELVARAIHRHSPRHGRPFVAVDCGTIPENLLESELFGHERGAFTGAVATKKGLLERAHGGTAFLDEIGDIGPALQSKLLRVLQEREIRHVGGDDPISIDVRIIAASNKDLFRCVQDETFREDLYYRLNVVAITLPPLRDRPEDIPLLAEHFVRRYGTAKAKPVSGITPPAMALLTAYKWPGNVRELEHAIERAVVMTPHTMIFPDDLPSTVQSPSGPVSEGAGGWKTLEQMEREYIVQVLESCHDDLGRASDRLGIHRKTLIRKLQQYGHM